MERVEQHFGNAEAADGGLLFQGNVRGDVHIHRKLSPKRLTMYPAHERHILSILANFLQSHATVRQSSSTVSQKPSLTLQADNIRLPASRTHDEM